MRYLHNLGIAFGQLANAITGGDPDETLASRCWRSRLTHPWKSLCFLLDFCFFWQTNEKREGHCQQAWQYDMQRLHIQTTLLLCKSHRRAEP